MNIEQIKAEYLDHMGSDLTVVNAARTSFGKESELVLDEYGNAVLKAADANLIRFLASGYRTSEWDELLNDIIATVEFDCDLDERKQTLTALLKAYKRKAQH